MRIDHWLNRTLAVWRPVTGDDGSGGQTVTMTLVGDVAGKVDAPSAAEQVVAAQAGAQHTHTVFLAPEADVRRNDELRGDGQTFTVVAVTQPSTPRYQKANVELVEAGA